MPRITEKQKVQLSKTVSQMLGGAGGDCGVTGLADSMAVHDMFTNANNFGFNLDKFITHVNTKPVRWQGNKGFVPAPYGQDLTGATLSQNEQACNRVKAFHKALSDFAQVANQFAACPTDGTATQRFENYLCFLTQYQDGNGPLGRMCQAGFNSLYTRSQDDWNKFVKEYGNTKFLTEHFLWTAATCVDAGNTTSHQECNTDVPTWHDVYNAGNYRVLATERATTIRDKLHDLLECRLGGIPKESPLALHLVDLLADDVLRNNTSKDKLIAWLQNPKTDKLSTEDKKKFKKLNDYELQAALKFKKTDLTPLEQFYFEKLGELKAITDFKDLFSDDVGREGIYSPMRKRINQLKGDLDECWPQDSWDTDTPIIGTRYTLNENLIAPFKNWLGNINAIEHGRRGAESFETLLPLLDRLKISNHVKRAVREYADSLSNMENALWKYQKAYLNLKDQYQRMQWKTQVFDKKLKYQLLSMVQDIEQKFQQLENAYKKEFNQTKVLDAQSKVIAQQLFQKQNIIQYNQYPSEYKKIFQKYHLKTTNIQYLYNSKKLLHIPPVTRTQRTYPQNSSCASRNNGF